MRTKSIEKVTNTEMVVSSGREKPLSSATVASTSITIETVRPIGTEY